MDKKKNLVVFFSVLFTLVLLLGGTYAWLKVTVESDTKQVIHAGKLDLILDDETSNGINMENVVPISDEKGREQEGYTFRLINQGSMSSKYTVYLDDLDLEKNEVRMKDSAVKYALERDGEELSSGLLPSIGSNPNRVLDTGIINGNTTYVYKLKVWMDIDATSENMDTVFYAKIRVETEQVNIPVEKSDLELTPESKERVPIKEGENPKQYTYTSSDWDVVKVDEDGNIEVIGPGTAVITKKDQYGGKEEITVHVTVPVTAEFRTNDKIESIGSIENNKCDLTANKQTTCQINLPEVEVKEGYEFVGWSTEEDSHKGEKETVDISPDKKVLYPIVKKPGCTNQVTLVSDGEGIESIGSDNSLSCKAEDTYNNEEVKTSCKVTLPEIKAADGYTVIGWSTDSNATEGITPGSKVEVNGDTTFYPIVRKDATTITATFKLNKAASLDGKVGDITKSCEVHTDSAGNPLDSCVVAVPEIAASTATPNVIGFNTNKDAIVAEITPGTTTIEISENKIYYAITKSEAKEYIVTFYKNGANSLGGEEGATKGVRCNIPATYNGEQQPKTCKVTSPSIEASTNTPRVIGYSTSVDDHKSSWNAGEEKSISSNGSFYAQTANDTKITYTATYEKGSNVTSIGKNSDSCDVEVSYNGTERGNSCTITAPTITPNVGYTSVGYSETEDDMTGSTNLVLTKDATFYANAVANSYKIEYYSEDEKVGESAAQVGTSITLMTMEALEINKNGYSFKGWDANSAATTGVYADGAEVSNLSTTEGAVVKLYAVWVDDIIPTCTFNLPEGNYKVDDIITATLTCTDDGVGFDESSTTVPQLWTSYKLVNSNRVDDLVLQSSSCVYNSNDLTCNYELLANNVSSPSAYVLPRTVADKNGNSNYMPVFGNTISIEGKTFTATLSKEGVDGVSALNTTALSCTTEDNNRSCSITIFAPQQVGFVIKDGYRYKGWNVKQSGNYENSTYQLNLTEDTTYYPSLQFVFVAAYDYNETKGDTNYCVTGDESTCQETDCYFDKTKGICPMGTIIKYFVDNDSTEPRYFHVIEDKGTVITMQERSNTATAVWTSSDSLINKGPTAAIEAIEATTENWRYVNTQTYTMGTTPFGPNNSFHTGCNDETQDCKNVYEWEERSAKARLITFQEVMQTSCRANAQNSCPIWMYNYLGTSNSELGTQGGDKSDYYIMNAHSGGYWVLFIMSEGRIAHNTAATMRGVRAVVDINKYDR